MLIHPLVSLRLVGAGVGVASMACRVKVVGVAVGLTASWVEGTSTDVVDGVTD